MSRGLGRVERLIMWALTADKYQRLSQSMDTGGLTRLVFNTESPTASQAASVRRALGSLQRKGLVSFVVRRSATREKVWESVEERERVDRNARAGYHRRRREDIRMGEDLPKIPEDKLKLLRRTLGMLGSAHDGEVLNAAKASERLRREMGVSWDDLNFERNFARRIYDEIINPLYD